MDAFISHHLSRNWSILGAIKMLLDHFLEQWTKSSRKWSYRLQYQKWLYLLKYTLGVLKLHSALQNFSDLMRSEHDQDL